MNGEHRTFEARVLDLYPEIRTAVVNSPAFADWLRTLTKVVVDGETLYVRGGDILRDRDQIIFEWARRNGQLTGAAIERAEKNR
jgi:hypothetical protein